MDTTPSKKMFEVMEKLTDAFAGEKPGKAESQGKTGRAILAKRRLAMDVLHDLVRLSMREGVRRDREMRGMPTVEDQVRPQRLNRDVQRALEDSVERVAAANDQ